MSNGYLTFLDYLELRRRVERRLASGNYFLLHIFIFGAGATFIGLAGWSPYIYGWFVYPVNGHLVSLWSGILLAHGLLDYWRSGARAGQREGIIENEMRERLQSDDMYLSNHPKDLFRLHGLLNDDIQKRASMTPMLLVFVFINACVWIPWTLAGQASTSFAWMMAMVLVIPFILAVVWNVWRRVRHEAQLRKQLEAYFSKEQIDDEPFDEREIRLSDDGDELVTVDEYMMKRKRN